MTADQSVAWATWGLVLVTAGLIVVTYLLVRDGARKSAEQLRRWEEEDRGRLENAKPTGIVELATVENSFDLDLFFACFNLGNNTFFIDKLIVTAADGTRDESDLTPKIVIPGTYVTIGYDPGSVMGLFGEKEE